MKRKRLQVYALLAVCLTIIIAGFLSMARDIAARPVSYGVERITPLVTNLCPGDVMEYPLAVDIIDHTSRRDHCGNVVPCWPKWCLFDESGQVVHTAAARLPSHRNHGTAGGSQVTFFRAWGGV